MKRETAAIQAPIFLRAFPAGPASALTTTATTPTTPAMTAPRIASTWVKAFSTVFGGLRSPFARFGFGLSVG